MKTALVIYNTKKGATKKLAECISEGLNSKGVEVTIKESEELASVEDLKNFDGYVLGSPTYYTEPLEDTARILELAAEAELKGKVGAAFGAYGWSGEAPDIISAAMGGQLEMDMLPEPLVVKTPATDDECARATSYGELIAQKMGA